MSNKRAKSQQPRIWEVESVESYLARGGTITTCPPARNPDLFDWNTMIDRLDNSAPPMSTDVTVTRWSLGSDISTAIQEAAAGSVPAFEE